MKKTIMFLGVLSLGLAQAQQNDPYEGKVGINTDTPTATLNVKSKTGTTDATKNFELQNANGGKLVTVRDNGYVGIGTEIPKQKLQVFGHVNFSDSEVFTGGLYGLEIRNSTGKMAEFYYSDRATKTYPRLQIKGAVNKINIITSFSTGGANLGIGTASSPDLLYLREDGSAKLNYVGIGTLTPEYKLHIKPSENKEPLKLEGLQETTDANAKNLVVVDGVVKVGEAVSTGATQLSGTDDIVCNKANRGKLNFKQDVDLGGGKTADAMGVCLKGSDGNYHWNYMYGNGGKSTGSNNAFGTGLQ